MGFIGEEPWLQIECTFCFAEVGERCRVHRREAVTRGFVISHGTPHVDRTIAWQEIVMQDYDPVHSYV